MRSIKNALIFRIIRGGFLYPLSDVVYIATDNYISVNKLGKIDEFKLAPFQRQFVVHTTMSALDEEDFFFFYEEACENNHKLVNITEMLIWSFTNVLLNNLYLKNNDNIV